MKLTARMDLPDETSSQVDYTNADVYSSLPCMGMIDFSGVNFVTPSYRPVPPKVRFNFNCL